MLNTLKDLWPRTAIGLRNCPMALQLLELRRAWRRWCEETAGWRQEITYNLTANTKRYNLKPGSYAAEVRRAGRVWVLSESDVTNSTRGAPLPPDAWHVERDEDRLVLVFEWAPVSADRANALIVEQVLVPETDSTEDPPSQLLNQTADALVAGALAALYLMDKKAWTNPGKGGLEENKFNNAVALGARDQDGGRRQGALVMRPANFF